MEKEQINLPGLNNKYIDTAVFYSQVIDSLQDYSIFTIDKNLLINSWNSGSQSIFGYEAEEAIGRNFEIIFTDEDKESGVPKHETDLALKDGRAVDNRWQVRKDGSRFYAYGLVFPLTGIDGELIGFTKILRDLTEKRKSEEAIKKYVKDLEELITHKDSILSILSHDLRSPLARIIETIDYLLLSIVDMEPDKVKETIGNIQKASIDELAMLDYLLRWARIRCASDAFSPVKIELFQFVEKIFDGLGDAAAIKKIKLYNEVEKNANVYADNKMLLSVFLNIITNALQHTPPGGKVVISSRREDDNVCISIEDNGVGMSKEIHSKLFTPQMDSLSNSIQKEKGAGIGLILVKGFLEKNGGTIWVESMEGAGSTFYFTLPSDAPVEKTAVKQAIALDNYPLS
jgi:PAS domain S-box-containing protein